MSRRRPTKAERERVVTLDLLADWRAYAEPLPTPMREHDWRYFGAITIDGQTGALAWRAGGYGIGNGASVRELGLWDRIKVTALLMRDSRRNQAATLPVDPTCGRRRGRRIAASGLSYRADVANGYKLD
jgi:hypothetical protein